MKNARGQRDRRLANRYAPRPNALDLLQCRGQRRVVHGVQAVARNQTLVKVPRNVQHVLSFAVRKANGTQRLLLYAINLKVKKKKHPQNLVRNFGARCVLEPPPVAERVCLARHQSR